MATITDTGLEVAAKRFNGVTQDAATYVGTGSGSTAEATTDTGLVTENTTDGSARAAATCTYEATGVSKWVKQFDFTGAITVREIAIFTASSGSNAVYRHVLTADRNYTSGQSLEITITNTFGR